MFDTTVVNRNETTVVVPPKKPDVTKIEIKKSEEGSVFVHCRKDDNIWKGLFYNTPFLNRDDKSRGNFYSVKFDSPTRLKSYEEMRWLTSEENDRDRKRHNENQKTILRIQAVDVIQIRFINDTEVIAEVKYLNPKEA